MLETFILLATAGSEVLPGSSEMPDITPDFSFPAITGIVQVVSWILAIAISIAFIALIGSLIAVVSKGFGIQSIQNHAGSALIWSMIGIAALGSASAIFQWLVGFDLGF